jgi:tetratricopeptide (TPR) repeat protein
MTADNEKEVQALIQAALASLQRGDAGGALAILVEAEKNHPGSLGVKLNLALVHRTLADYPAALRALDAALAIDPYFFLALLSKAAVLEQMNELRLAAETYRNALWIAPPAHQVPPSLVQPIQHPREIVTNQAELLQAHLRLQLGGLLEQHADQPLARLNECLDVLAGTRQIYNAEPIQLKVPRLPALPFFDRAYFPWLPQLEAATEAIRGEVLALLEAGLPGFAPYIQYAPYSGQDCQR